MDQEAGLGKKFFVQLEGNTNGAHQEFVTKLQCVGYIEVDSRENSDYLVVFCPIVSRVGTDISEALENIPDNKPVILVVLHQTFDRDHVVAESRRLVEKPNVRLTVDCLFYQGKLLNCNRNDIAWFEIQKFLGVPFSQSSTRTNFCRNVGRIKTAMAVVAVLLLILIVIGIVGFIIYFEMS